MLYSVNDELVFVRNRKAGDELHNLKPTVCTQGFAAPIPPELYPPTFVKAGLDRNFAQWDRARDILRKADRIAFVGYSFPQSDTYMRYFLGTALATNRWAEKFDIIDPVADEIVKRLKSSGYGDEFCNRLRPVVRKWQEWEEDAVTEGGYDVRRGFA